MRLIDADALADALFEKGKNYPQWVADTIGNIPDAITRCKNCRNAQILHWLDNAIICTKHSYTGVRPDEFFCADGEPKFDS